MGIAMWLGLGAAAFALARIVPLGRRPRWIFELLAALTAALALGFVATALDFGGWSEPDWRAGVFVLFGALAAVGVVRGVTMRS